MTSLDDAMWPIGQSTVWIITENIGIEYLIHSKNTNKMSCEPQAVLSLIVFHKLSR